MADLDPLALAMPERAEDAYPAPPLTREVSSRRVVAKNMQSNVRLAFVSQVDELDSTELTQVAKAVQTQIQRDFAPHWGVEATVSVYQTLADVPYDCWPIIVLADPGQGTSGLHLEKDGQPYALVRHEEGWSLTASHQCLEILGDPRGTRLVRGLSPHPDQGQVDFLVQVCDPCEAHQFAYQIDGVTVSDFVTPAFYGGEGDRFDFTSAIEKPLQVLPGGYISWHHPSSDHWWQQVYFDEAPRFRDLGVSESSESSDATNTQQASAEEPEVETAIAQTRAGAVPGAANDQVSAIDQLGFRDYVTAFADLIGSAHTQPPITIGIFGSWGVGKSFLLRHIREELLLRAEHRSASGEDAMDGASAPPHVHVVELNAWAYSASEAVWPSLVRKVMECGEHEIAWAFPGRFVRTLWSNLVWELHQERGKLLAALFTTIILLTIVLWRLNFQVGVLAAVAAGLGATGLLKVVADTFANPLTKWVTTVLRSGEYGEDLDYMRRIRHDLEALSSRLDKENGRIVVLIDDLDRCEPDKIIEVLQAINLLLNFKAFIVCLGVDARLVTRAIERHYAGMLEKAHASGYEYLDKIVQIPFRIPPPSHLDVRSFLTMQLRGTVDGAGDSSPTDTAVPSVGEELPGEGLAASSARTADPALIAGPGARPLQGTSEKSVAFTDDEIAAFEELARFLDPNPRHLKRIVNVYRLVRSLATVRNERFVLEDPAGTIRLLALASQWPFTLSAMFDRLDDMAMEEAAGKKWPRADPLQHLYRNVRPALDLGRQSELDHELDDLDRLLTEVKGRLSWKALVSLRRYIVNFNPAVEEELRAAQAAAELAARSAKRAPRRRPTRATAPARVDAPTAGSA